VLAWAVREGATNALRHSAASSWTVTARAEGVGNGESGGRLTLEIVNDGAAPAAPALAPASASAEDAEPGRGLAGLAERARSVGGTASAGPSPDGRFTLRVDVPRAAP
jgi:two-component system sensor histidine kinase DesK